MKAWLHDVWQVLTKDRYTDRRGQTWQFDVYAWEWYKEYKE